jgi:hypothetical protein
MISSQGSCRSCCQPSGAASHLLLQQSWAGWQFSANNAECLDAQETGQLWVAVEKCCSRFSAVVVSQLHCQPL